MNFFQYVFCNQYAAIGNRSVNTRFAQFYTIIFSAGLATMYLLIIAVLYARLNPHQAEADLITSKPTGVLFGSGTALVVFTTVRLMIGSKEWYDTAVAQYRDMNPEQRQRAARKGGRYLFIASLPVAVFILWLIASLF